MLDNTKVTDAGLVHLQGLSQLQDLGLDDTKVTDAGLVHLQGLSQLQVLELDNTKVTDAGLVHLQGLSQLQALAALRHPSHRRRAGASPRVESTPSAVAQQHQSHRRRTGASPRVESTPRAWTQRHQSHRRRAGASPRVESTPIAVALQHQSHRRGREETPAGIAELQDYDADTNGEIMGTVYKKTAPRPLPQSRLRLSERRSHEPDFAGHDRRRRAQNGCRKNALGLLVHREGTGLHLDADAVLFRQVRWYSPRVPAGETSAILEIALLDDFALGVGDGELGFDGRPPSTIRFVHTSPAEPTSDICNLTTDATLPPFWSPGMEKPSGTPSRRACTAGRRASRPSCPCRP